MKEIFYELIQEASQGKVIIDNEIWPIGFNTKFEALNKGIMNNFSEQFPTLIIKEEEKFFQVLNEYVLLELSLKHKTFTFVKNTKKNNIKFILAYLFVNASTQDFLNPITYIKRRISFLQDTTFHDIDKKTFDLGAALLNTQLEIINKEQSIMMETPYKMEMAFKKIENDQEIIYPFASINYGIQIQDLCCYIYSIQKPKDNQNATSFKKISRILYKLNEGVSDLESKEYLNYKTGNDSYYPENISDVTIPFVFSLTLFLNFLQQKNIRKVKVVPFLPLRYLSRQIMSDNIEDVQKKEQLKERNNRIQENITNKFIRTFNRTAFHFPDLQIISYPYELDEYLTCSIKNSHEKINPSFLKEIVENINIEEARKR